MTPTFSIITVTKNSGTDFQATSLSLKSLLFKDFEWIVVDGSDQLSSQHIVDKCIEGRAVLIRGKDRGISHAFNIGIRASIGTYILILNAGDTYSPDFLNVCLEYANISSIVCGSATLVSPLNEVKGFFAAKPRSLWRGMHLPHNWMCVPSSLYHKIGFYREIPDAMDYEWCRRAISAFGPDIFKPLPGNSSYGTYSLGGYSYNRYLKGLYATKLINIEYGMPLLLAEIIFFSYYLKHRVSSCGIFSHV